MTPASAAALSDAFIRDALAKAVSIRPSRIVIAASAPDGADRSKYFQRLARQFDADLIDQGNGSLGRRMARALEPFSSNGALLIGTDTPSLPAALLDCQPRSTSPQSDRDRAKPRRRLLRSRRARRDASDFHRNPMGQPQRFRFNHRASQTRRHSIRARPRVVRRRSMARRAPARRPPPTAGAHAPPHRRRQSCPATESVLIRLGLLRHAR